MSLRSDIKFQKALALATFASNTFEAEAAELALRRLMAAHHIDPVVIPDQSFCSDMDFAGNALLKKLRDEWRAQHPDYFYSKPSRNGRVRRLRNKPRVRKPRPVDVSAFAGLFDDFMPE